MDDKLFLAAYTGLVALFSGLVGFLVNHYLTLFREINLRRRSETAHYLERQIGEFYGPLLGLIEHSERVHEILRKKLADQAVPKIDFTKLNEQDGQVWRFFQESFFLPMNSEIRDRDPLEDPSPRRWSYAGQLQSVLCSRGTLLLPAPTLEGARH